MVLSKFRHSTHDVKKNLWRGLNIIFALPDPLSCFVMNKKYVQTKEELIYDIFLALLLLNMVSL